MALSIGWGASFQTFEIPLDLASADDKSKWTYVQHRLIGSSHREALCAALQELYPGLGFGSSIETPLPYDVAVFGTPAAELYGKPDTSPSTSSSLNSSPMKMQMGIPSLPYQQNTHSHRRPPPSTSRPSTHGGSGTKAPDRRPTQVAISTPSQPLFRRPMVSQNQRPLQRPTSSATEHMAGPPVTVATRL